MFIFLLLLFISAYKVCISYDEGLTDKDKLVAHGLYYNFQDIKTFSEMIQNRSLIDVINSYYSECFEPNRLTNPKKKFPFIAIEGIHSPTCNVLMEKLAQAIGAVALQPLPYHFRKIVKTPPKGLYGNVIFSIGMYRAGCKARDLTEHSPVVIHKYWSFRAAFASSMLFGLHLPNSSDIYNWPKDLLQPDIILYLNSRKNNWFREHNPDLQDFKPVFDMFYKRLNGPKVIVFESRAGHDETFTTAVRVINKELKTNYKTPSYGFEQVL